MKVTSTPSLELTYLLVKYKAASAQFQTVDNDPSAVSAK